MTRLVLPLCNHLPPADGQTHSVSDIYTLDPINAFEFDGKYFAVDNFEFKPKGIFVDNTGGTSEVRIRIEGINYSWRVPVSAMGRVSIPAAFSGGSIYLTGGGPTPVTFVDYAIVPGLEWPNGQPVNVGNFPAVQSVDDQSNVSRVLLGRSFFGSSYGVPTAGAYSVAQIFNPVGNNKNVVLESITITKQATGLVFLSYGNTALGTLVSRSGNKLIGGVAPTAKCYTDNPTLPLAPITLYFAVAANSQFDFILKEPMVLQPGWGVSVSTNTLNDDVLASFEWYEG